MSRNYSMVDLKSQYRRLKPEIDDAINAVLESSAFIKGPQVAKFEQNLAQYLDVKHVIGCANGTDALQIAMMALGYQPGDELITASFTYVATAEAMALLHLKPVLVEVDKDTFTIDPAAIEEAITPKTRAIVPVHIFGQGADMEAILQIAKKHKLDVIEDTAQAIGAEYTFENGKRKRLGAIGTVGTTSFFPSKNLGGYGDGGALFAENDDLAEHIRRVGNHGQTAQYVHDEIGINSRLDTIQAAILDVKLKHLDDFARRRQQVAAYYDDAFSGLEGVQVPVRASYSTHVFHQYSLILNGMDRDEVMRRMKTEKGIETRVYYPIPLHLQKAYATEYEPGAFAITERLCSSALSLPIHTELKEDDLKYIADSFKSIVREEVRRTAQNLKPIG